LQFGASHPMRLQQGDMTLFICSHASSEFGYFSNAERLLGEGHAP
jgi:hypothetical protein